jgi:hypothetical protein
MLKFEELSASLIAGSEVSFRSLKTTNPDKGRDKTGCPAAAGKEPNRKLAVSYSQFNPRCGG